LSPEQRQGRPADARSDLFSLGAILWFLLTGLPYYSEGEDGNSKAVLLDRFKPQGGEIPGPLLTFMWRALQRSPNHRYESAADMGAELERAITPAAPAVVAQFVCELFAVERKIAAEDAEEWKRKYSPRRSASAERTAVIDRGTPPKGARETLVLDRVPRSRAPLVVFVALGVAAIMVGIILALRRPPTPAATRPTPTPIVVEPNEPKPAPPAPVAPIPIPPVHVEPTPTPVHVEPAPHAPALAPLLRRVQEAQEMAARGQTGRAREVLAALEKDARLKLPVKIALADVEYSEGHFDKAIELASQAVRSGGGVAALTMRASAELKAGKAKEAMRDFDRVLAAQPNNDDAREGKKAAQRLLEGTP
jgi:hypothetical protein